MSPPRTYVMRCLGCKVPRGASSFRVLRTAGRSATCKWCEDRAANEIEAKRAAARREWRELRRREGRLRRNLADVRDQLRDAKVRMDRLERETPTPTLRIAIAG